MSQKTSRVSKGGLAVVVLLIAAGFVVLWLQSGNSRNRILLSSESRGAARIPEVSVDANPAPSDGIKLPATSAEILRLLQVPDHRLNQTEVKAALDYLKRPKPAETAADPAAEYYNNIIAILLAQPGEVAGLSEALVTVVDNKSLPLLLRDYAMQHFYHAWIREKSPVLKHEIESRLKIHFEDADSPLQGVALLTTSRMLDKVATVKGPSGEKLVAIGTSPARDPFTMSKPTLFSGQDLVNSAIRVTEDSTAAPNARSCAFSVLVRLEVHQAVYPARQILHEATAPDEVRCSAIAAVGAFGDLATDQAFLDSIQARPEFVRAAAEHALRSLRSSQNEH